MKKNKILETIESEYKGQKITVKVLKPKEHRVVRSTKRKITSCPNCMSNLILDEVGLWKCTGDKLKVWEVEFYRYHRAKDKLKVEILTNFSDSGMFLELYDRWAYSQVENEPEEYNCGYTNKTYPPVNHVKVSIPDPIFCGRIEKKLGRKLTEEELLGEHELFFFGGQVLTKYRKGAKRVKIPFIIFPDDV